MVQEHTASSEPAAAAAAYDTRNGPLRPSQRVMLAFGVSAAIALAKSGTLQRPASAGSMAAGAGAHHAFVQHAHRVAIDLFAEVEDAVPEGLSEAGRGGDDVGPRVRVPAMRRSVEAGRRAVQREPPQQPGAQQLEASALVRVASAAPAGDVAASGEVAADALRSAAGLVARMNPLANLPSTCAASCCRSADCATRNSRASSTP